MPLTTVTCLEFSQDAWRAMEAAESGPVVITDCGKSTHVLLSIEDYRRLAHQRRSLAEALSMPGLSEIEFDPPRIVLGLKSM